MYLLQQQHNITFKNLEKNQCLICLNLSKHQKNTPTCPSAASPARSNQKGVCRVSNKDQQKERDQIRGRYASPVQHFCFLLFHYCSYCLIVCHYAASTALPYFSFTAKFPKCIQTACLYTFLYILFDLQLSRLLTQYLRFFLPLPKVREIGILKPSFLPAKQHN